MREALGDKTICNASILSADLDPLHVFEALNIRGLKLEPFDLLRSFLMKTASELDSFSMREAIFDFISSKYSVRDNKWSKAVIEYFEKKKLELKDRIDEVFCTIQKLRAQGSHLNTCKVLNLHYFIIWVLPWYMRKRERKGRGPGNASEDKPHEKLDLQMKQLRTEYENIMKCRDIVKLISKEQEHEYMKEQSKVRIGFDAAGEGEYCEQDSGIKFPQTIFPNLAMAITGRGSDKADKERIIRLAFILICRLKYYLETLEPFMQQMIPFTGSHGELSPVEEAPDDRTTLERIRCQQLVKSMQLLMTKGGTTHIQDALEFVIGACSVDPTRKGRFERLSKALFTLRIIILNVCVRRKGLNVDTKIQIIKHFARIVPLKVHLNITRLHHIYKRSTAVCWRNFTKDEDYLCHNLFRSCLSELVTDHFRKSSGISV